MTDVPSDRAPPAHILADLWSMAGGDLSALEAVVLTGQEPALPSSFRVGALAQAAIAAAGLAGRWRELDSAVVDNLALLSAPRLHRSP